MELENRLSRDPIIRIAAIVLLATVVPYFLPFLDPDTLFAYADRYAFIPPLAVAIVAIQVGLRGAGGYLDRQFWHFWTVAYGFWLANRIIFLAIPVDSWNASLDLFTDFLYVLLYLALILAFGSEPDRREPGDLPRSLSSLENAGLAMLLLGLFVYFAVIPGVFDRAAYDSWVPSMLLYVALDAYVLVRCIYLWTTSPSIIWRRTYGWLVAACSVLLATDIFETLEYAELVPGNLQGTLFDLPWFFPFAAVIIAARIHHNGVGTDGTVAEGSSSAGKSSRRSYFGGSLVVGALILPIVHFTCYSIGLLDESTRSVRGLLVLAVLLALLAMEVVDHQLIQRKNRQLDSSRKRAEDLRQLLATAVEHAGESIMITDIGGTIEYVNPSFEKSLGYSAEEVVGKKPRLLKSGLHDDEFYRQLWTTIMSGQVWHGRMVNRRKDGSLCEQSASIAPVMDESGEIVRFVAVERDITQQVQLERQLGESQKMEALGTLAGGIAHDFNNILQAIVGYTEVIRDELPVESREDSALDMVLRSVDRAKGVIKQILSFARKPKDERESTDIPALIEETVSLLRASLPSTIAIHANISGDAGTVFADPHQLHQVLLNLGSNAAYAIGDRPGRLDVEASRYLLDSSSAAVLDGLPVGEYVGVTVRDSGAGIEAETVKRVFEPFFTTKDVGAGTGLGLSVAHGIVHGHGGAFEVESEVGKGTMFRFYLPLVQPEERVSSTSEVTRGGGQGTGHVLVVDDEKPIQELVRRHLERLGYSVTVASDGDAGLRAFEAQPDAFNVIITDHTMPGRTGLQLAREVKRSRADLPIVLITGLSSVVTAESAQEAGIGAVLTKPFTVQELAATIEDVLES